MNINDSTNLSFGWVFHNLLKHPGHFGCSQAVADVSNAAVQFPTDLCVHIWYFLRLRPILVHSLPEGIYQCLLQPAGYRIVHFLLLH